MLFFKFKKNDMKFIAIGLLNEFESKMDIHDPLINTKKTSLNKVREALTGETKPTIKHLALGLFFDIRQDGLPISYTLIKLGVERQYKKEEEQDLAFIKHHAPEIFSDLEESWMIEDFNQSRMF